MKRMRFLLLVFSLIPAVSFASLKDSISETPLKHEVLSKNADVDDYLWIAGDKHYNIYYRDSNLIVERKNKGTLWLIRGNSFASYPSEELFIDSVYFVNVTDNTQKELVVKYSQFSLKTSGSNTKSKHILIIDLTDKKVLLNIATYDFKISPDENGRVIDYLYEAEVELSRNFIHVTKEEDSDIDNPNIQLEPGTYRHRGRCFMKLAPAKPLNH